MAVNFKPYTNYILRRIAGGFASTLCTAEEAAAELARRQAAVEADTASEQARRAATEEVMRPVLDRLKSLSPPQE